MSATNFMITPLANAFIPLESFDLYYWASPFSRKRKMSGFGHRVYKNYDPRAKVIKKLAEEVFSIVGRDPLIEVIFHSIMWREGGGVLGLMPLLLSYFELS
jgi:citrate synthase